MMSLVGRLQQRNALLRKASQLEREATTLQSSLISIDPWGLVTGHPNTFLATSEICSLRSRAGLARRDAKGWWRRNWFSMDGLQL